MSLKISVKPKLIITFAVTGIVIYWLVKREVTETISTVGSAVNPTNKDNIFSQAADKVGNVIAGDSNDIPLGSRIFDFFHGPDE